MNMSLIVNWYIIGIDILWKRHCILKFYRMKILEGHKEYNKIWTENWSHNEKRSSLYHSTSFCAMCWILHSCEQSEFMLKISTTATFLLHPHKNCFCGSKGIYGMEMQRPTARGVSRGEAFESNAPPSSCPSTTTTRPFPPSSCSGGLERQFIQFIQLTAVCFCV